MSKKVLFLINDLVTLDKTVFPDEPTFTRKTIAAEPNFLNRLFEILLTTGQDFGNGQNWDVRENLVIILIEVFDVNPSLREPYNTIITSHKLKLAKEVQVCPPDQQELFLKELKIIEGLEQAG